MISERQKEAAKKKAKKAAKELTKCCGVEFDSDEKILFKKIYRKWEGLNFTILDICEGESSNSGSKKYAQTRTMLTNFAKSKHLGGKGLMNGFINHDALFII